MNKYVPDEYCGKRTSRLYLEQDDYDLTEDRYESVVYLCKKCYTAT